MTRGTQWSLLVVLVGCAATEPGADLELVPDPNVNTPAQVLDAVDSVILIVDSLEGLYPPGAERSAGDVQIENADTDPELELVIDAAVPNDHLPRIRILQGSLPDGASLDVRVLGVPSELFAAPVAAGHVAGVRLEPAIPEVAIPFNLYPARLPPRVAEVHPLDGSMIEGCTLDRIFVMFSRAIDPATLAGAVHLEPAGEVTQVRMGPSNLSAELVTAGLSGDGSSLRYRLRVTTELRGEDGVALDQIPAEPGAQSFVSEIALRCGPLRSAPTGQCGELAGPLPEGCPYPPRLRCADERCVPAACEGAACVEGFVCAPASARCEPDCRLWGEASACPPERPRCAADGACAADTPQ